MKRLVASSDFGVVSPPAWFGTGAYSTADFAMSQTWSLHFLHSRALVSIGFHADSGFEILCEFFSFIRFQSSSKWTLAAQLSLLLFAAPFCLTVELSSGCSLPLLLFLEPCRRPLALLASEYLHRRHCTSCLATATVLHRRLRLPTVATDHRKATDVAADEEADVAEATTTLLEEVIIEAHSPHNPHTAATPSSTKDSRSTQQHLTPLQAAILLIRDHGRPMDSRQRRISTPQYLSPPQIIIQTMVQHSNTPRRSTPSSLPMDSNLIHSITKQLLRLARPSGLVAGSRRMLAERIHLMLNRLLVVAIPSSILPAIILLSHIHTLVRRHRRHFRATTHITACEEGVAEAITETEIEVGEEGVDVAGIKVTAIMPKSKTTITAITTATRTPTRMLPRTKSQPLPRRQRRRSAR